MYYSNGQSFSLKHVLIPVNDVVYDFENSNGGVSEELVWAGTQKSALSINLGTAILGGCAP